MANKANLRICLAISMFLLTIAGLAQAATITVGSGADYDFDTIQAGIDVAVDGDTVLVAPGEYVITEPVTFRGKAITVKSEAGQDETTIRMGTPADTNRGSVVVFENNETIASVFEGLTITGGRGCWGIDSLVGGGIFFNASSGTLRNCAIVQNKLEGAGGGILCAYTCSPILIDCIIAENSAELGFGGGVFAWSGASVTLADCNITENSAGVSGGGVFCGTNSSTTLTNCTISKNSAGDAGGGAICDIKSSMIMTGCTISENYAANHGAGIMSWDNSSVTLGNCTITKNSSGSEEGAGFCGQGSSMTITNCSITENSGATECGAILCWQGSFVTVTNSIVWGNKAPQGGELRVRNGRTLTISYSDVAGGQAGVIVEGSTLNWGEGNIDADPCFADPANDDFHLKSEAGRWTSASSVEPDPNSKTWVLDDVTSLCIDAGDPNSDWTAELWPHGERINMGAYGGTSQASRSLSDAGNVADLNRDGIVDSADMRIMVDHWGTDEPLCDIGPMPFGDGIVDVQDLIVLAEHLFEESN